MNETAIRVEHVNKSYRHFKNNHQRFNGTLLGRDIGEKVEIIKDMSFEVKRGEKTGILGGSGTGKTSILKMIAGFIKPDSGLIEINGKITPYFDHRLCFDGTLSVLTNLRIKAAVLGWKKEEIRERESEILEFAELTDSANEPLRSLSRGSAVRLGCAISTMVKPEILIFDENLRFGGPQYDVKFQERLRTYMEGDDVTVLMSVSSPTIGKKYCQRGIVLKEDGIAFDGTYEDAFSFYKKHYKKMASGNQSDETEIHESEMQSDDSSDYGF